MKFKAASRYVRPEDMEMGFSTITFHNVSQEQEAFVRDFGQEIGLV